VWSRNSTYSDLLRICCNHSGPSFRGTVILRSSHPIGVLIEECATAFWERENANCMWKSLVHKNVFTHTQKNEGLQQIRNISTRQDIVHLTTCSRTRPRQVEVVAFGLNKSLPAEQAFSVWRSLTASYLLKLASMLQLSNSSASWILPIFVRRQTDNNYSAFVSAVSWSGNGLACYRVTAQRVHWAISVRLFSNK